MLAAIYARFRRVGRRLICCALLVVSPAACVGPGGHNGARAVRVVDPDQALGCTDRGSVHVSVVDKLPELERREGAVARELRELARSSALQLGGNTLVPLTDILDGSQSFAVFQCP